MQSEEPKQPDRFWRKFGKLLNAGLLRFRKIFEKHPLLLLFYQIVVGAIGSLIVVAGILMLVLPGPGWVTIFFGLAILGTEFRWARRSIMWLRIRLVAILDRWRRYRAARRAEKEAQEQSAQSPET